MFARVQILLRALAAYLALAAGFGCLISMMKQLEKSLDESPVVSTWEPVAPHQEAETDFGPDGEEPVKIDPPHQEDSKPKRERPLVLVDAGHGGGDGGAVHNGIIEKNLTLDIALKVKSELERLGFDVHMTRDSDASMSLQSRVHLANQVQADALVSIHLNSAGKSTEVHGIETYYSGRKSLSAARSLQKALQLPTMIGLKDRRGEIMAQSVQRHVSNAAGALNRGIREQPLVVVEGATCASVLVECGFITNVKEAGRIKSEVYRSKLASGIAHGVAAYLQTAKSDPQHGIELPEIVSEDLPPKDAVSN